jgi:hypothetical protein
MQISAKQTDLVARLGLTGPVIQAPIAGGAYDAGAYCSRFQCGALGSLGGAYQRDSGIERVGRVLPAAKLSELDD